MSVRAFVEYLSLEKNYSPLTCLAYRRDLELFSDFIESNFDGQSVDSVVYPQIRNWIVILVEEGTFFSFRQSKNCFVKGIL